MSGGVVHLERHGELHASAKAFCKRHGLKLKDWASALILAAVEAPHPPKKERP